MADSFDFLLKGGFGDSTGLEAVQHVDFQQMRMQRAVDAYRACIALPEVHIADRTEEFVPVVLGEDGEEMTYERRCEIMKNKTAMVDEAGYVRGFDSRADDIDYRDQFEDDINTEENFASCTKYRPATRVVQPREMQLVCDIDFGNTTSLLYSSDDDQVYQELVKEGDYLAAVAGGCVKALQAFSDALEGDTATEAYTSPAIRTWIRENFGGTGTFLLGVPLLIDEKVGDSICFTTSRLDVTYAATVVVPSDEVKKNL